MGEPTEATPVLLITDIGADIDDTLALLVLLGSPSLRLVGVVTAVNDGRARGALVRGWLRALGLPDSLPILPSVDPAVAACVEQPGFPTVAQAALGPVEDTPRRIIELATAHPGMVVLANAPVTPLAAAVQLDSSGVLKRNVRRLYLQGNVRIGPEGRLSPDPQAYNFRVHMGAVERVFQELREAVPLSLLGKFAAYQVGITVRDLEELARPGLPSLAVMAREQMDGFRRGNPELFYRLYPVPEQFRDSGSWEWFDNIPGGVVSHPYDPLCVLMAAEDANRGSQSVFDRQSVPGPAGCSEIVGNEKDEPRVVDPEGARQALLAAMARALQL